MPRKKSDTLGRTRKKERNDVCYVCSKAFYAKGDLRRHLLIHSGERPFKCDICDKAFRREAHLRGHKLTHTGERPHHCEICDRQFALKRALTRHMLIHTGEKPYVCETCNKGFTTKNWLEWHMAVHKGKTHRCSVCKNSYYRSVELRNHMMTHYGEKKHICEVCGKAFHWARNLRIHKSVHREREKKFVCRVCNKGYFQSYALQMHLKTHLEKLPCKCETCEKEFKTKNDFKEPHQTGEYVCELCFKRFRYRSTLESHLLLHTREKAHKCEECGQCFTLASCLRKHISKRHNEDNARKYNCVVCDKSFVSEKALEIHSANHSSERLPPCKLCRRAFSGAKSKGQSDLLTDHVPNCEMRNKALQQLSNIQTFPQSEGNAYVCDACNKIVPKEYFIRHLHAHIGDKPHKCEVCNSGFSNLSHLRKHSLKAHDKELEASERIPLTKPFSDLSELKQHLRTHTKEQNQSCEVCDKAFNRKEKYESYLMTGEAPPSPAPSYDSSGDFPDNHDPGDDWSDHQSFAVTQEIEIVNSELNTVSNPEPVKKKFQCHQCDRSYTRLDNLKIHYITHTGTRPHVCEFCGRGFLRRHVMRLHQLSHTGEHPHKCDVCDKKYLTKFELRQHLFTHTGERPHVCQFCKKGFKLKWHLKKHMKARHFVEMPGPKTAFSCEQCGKTFGLLQLLKKHLWTHSGETPYKCDVCHKSFGHKQSLKVHLQKHLSGKLSHICEFCSKAFSLELYLKRHIRKRHSTEKETFPCAECGKVLSSSYALKKHLLIHSGVKAYSCSVCDKPFIHNFALQKHILTHQLKCKWCDMKFPSRFLLLRHRASHSEEKIYGCNLCDKKFVRNSSLQGHLVCVHGPKRTFACELCPESFERKAVLEKHKHRQHPSEEQDLNTSLTCGSQDIAHSNTAIVKESNHEKAVDLSSITFLVPSHIIAELIRAKQGHSDILKESSCDSKTIENSMDSVGMISNESNPQEATNVLLVPSHVEDKHSSEKHGHSDDVKQSPSGSQLNETIERSVNPVTMPSKESCPQNAPTILLLAVQPPSLVKTNQLSEKQGHSDILKESSCDPKTIEKSMDSVGTIYNESNPQEATNVLLVPNQDKHSSEKLGHSDVHEQSSGSQLNETIEGSVSPVMTPSKESSSTKAPTILFLTVQPPSLVKTKQLSEKQSHLGSLKESYSSSQLKETIARRVNPLKATLKYSNPKKAANASVKIQPLGHAKAKHLTRKQGHFNIPKESTSSSKTIVRRVGPVKTPLKYGNPRNTASISSVRTQPPSHIKARQLSEAAGYCDGLKELSWGSLSNRTTETRVNPVKTLLKYGNPQNTASISSVKMKARQSSEQQGNSDSQKEQLSTCSQGQSHSSVSSVKTVLKENSQQKATTISSIKPWQGITRLRILQ